MSIIQRAISLNTSTSPKVFAHPNVNSPFTPDNSIAFPKMAVVDGHEDHPKQPALDEDGGFIWPGDEGAKRKAVPGVFVVEKYLTPTTIGDPLVEDDGHEEHHEEEGDHDHGENGHDEGDTNEEDGSTPAAADKEDGSTPTSRSLKRDTKDYVHQFTLSVGGLLLAVGGFVLAN